MKINSIGKIKNDEQGTRIILEKQYVSALTGIEGFKHLNILWWFDQTDNEDSRTKLIEKSPYQEAPEELGVFATRSPNRPNPIGLTCVYVTYIDFENGIIHLAYMDAENDTPVLDIKPYTPSLDRIENPTVPEWCKNWPNSLEESAEFDWSTVFKF